MHYFSSSNHGFVQKLRWKTSQFVVVNLEFWVVGAYSPSIVLYSHQITINLSLIQITQSVLMAYIQVICVHHHICRGNIM